MAAAMTTRNAFFTWPEDFRADFFHDLSFPRNINTRRSYAKFTRSVSVGVPSTSKPEPKPEPRKAKSVHFADSKGLALVSVLTFNVEKELQDEFSSLKLNREQRMAVNKAKGKAEKCRSMVNDEKRRPKEILTVSSAKLAAKVASQKLCLEKTELLDSAIRGTVCVHNLAYDKCVLARYTFDEWRNQSEVKASYYSNSSIKDTDKFMFEIPIPKESSPRNYKVEFAVCYSVLGETFWDNNNGFNYHVLFARGS